MSEERAEAGAEEVTAPAGEDCFLCKGAAVRLQFDEKGPSLRECLKEYFISGKRA